MTLESFYITCFLVGFLLSLVSFLVQTGHVHMPDAGGFHGGDAQVHGGHFHMDHGDTGHADNEAARAAGVVSKFNFSTITAFLAWFGGTGYLLARYTSIWTIVALALASLMGLAGATLVFWFLAKLVQRDRTLNPADFDMVGVLGRVSSPVFEGGVGEMIFSQDGARKCAPIRSDDGSVIEKDDEVVVTRYERGIAWVRRWADLAGMTSGQ